jgi:hypothetical protein
MCPWNPDGTYSTATPVPNSPSVAQEEVRTNNKVISSKDKRKPAGILPDTMSFKGDSNKDKKNIKFVDVDSTRAIVPTDPVNEVRKPEKRVPVSTSSKPIEGAE